MDLDKELQDSVKVSYLIRLLQDAHPKINFRNFYWEYLLANQPGSISHIWNAHFYSLYSKTFDVTNYWQTKLINRTAPFIDMYSSEPTLSTLIKILNSEGIDDRKIFGLYQYGSQVYGCATEQSDFDYILVVDEPIPNKEIKVEQSEINLPVNINIYNLVEFLSRIALHEIDALECAFLPTKNILYSSINFNDYIFRKDILRRSISEKASNSFVKAKKKLTVEKDFNPYIGKKSLFHSLRIINFGIQIARDGRISDYSAANNYWREIVENPENNWQYYKDKYQPVYNSMMTEFRKLAPKELNEEE